MNIYTQHILFCSIHFLIFMNIFSYISLQSIRIVPYKYGLYGLYCNIYNNLTYRNKRAPPNADEGFKTKNSFSAI